MTDQQKKEGFPGDQTISGVLRQAGLVQSTKELRLEPIARNPERRDYLTRRSFRVYAGGRPVCHLRVGKDLGDLRSRTQAFAEACPDIASRALFWHQSDGWDYLGTELIDGQSLEGLVIEGRLSSADALVKVQTVVSALERTLLPSDVGAATQEMDQFQSRACASPIFSGLDQQFLQDVIFPFVRQGALAGPQQTRWTNGDLIARNVLVDSRGGVRLVDYEFASRTHFYAEDWWRWRSISMLPPEALDLPGLPAMTSSEPWLEAYFILRHAVLVHKINGTAVTVSGLRQQMDRLVALVAAAHAGFRASVFLQPLAHPALKPPTQSAATAQLYWGSDESFCEERSQHLAYPINEDAKLNFMLQSVHGSVHLRIDPAGAPGILKVFGIRVRRHKSSKPLIALDETTGWEAVRMGNGLLRLGDSPALNLLSLNSDPNFFLPEVALGDTPRDLVCEVWLRFTPDLTTLPDLLRPLSSALVARAQAEAGLAEARQTLAALTEQQARTEEQFRQANATVEALQSAAAQAAAQKAALESELAKVRRELHSREQNLATLEAKAAAESAGRAQAEAGLAEARQTLAALAEQQARTEEQLRQAGATVQALQSAAAQAAERTASLESELAGVRGELHARELALATVEAKAGAESVARAQAEAELAQARQTLAALAGQQVRTEEQLRQAKATVLVLQSAAAQGAAQKAALESELAKVRRELHSREQNLATLEAKSAAESAARAQAEAALAQARQTQAALTEQQTRTEEQLCQANATVQALQSAAAQKSQQYFRLRADANHNLSRAFDLCALAEKEIAQLQDQLFQHESKVQQMQVSFSWRATSWLRALRRWFIDPHFGKPKPVKLPLPVRTTSFARTCFLPLPCPKFRSHVDAPRSLSAANGIIVVRGWALAEENIVLRRIRARIGERFYSGTYGLNRPDVAAAYPGSVQAIRSGFKVDVTIERADDQIDLEIADENGPWYRFFTQSLHRDRQPALHGSYAHWVQEFDTLTPDVINALRRKAASLPRQPLISIIIPVFNTPERWLVRAIDSVRAQVYPRWELCLADDASSLPHVRPLLQRYAAEDPRIRVILRDVNGRISAASNSALALATGEFTALLDHDDELPPHALLCVAETIIRHPDAEVIYSDEDKIDELGFRFDPHFKPDWNPELLNGQNYLSHLTVYRTAVLQGIGGFREGFEGAQDWDLALRVTERTPPAHIQHIPRVLYHWRAIEGSTAASREEKDYVGCSAEQALSEHFTRQGLAVKLTPTSGGHWRVWYSLPEPPPLVTLIIPTRNRRELLVSCIDSIIARTAYPNFEILVVDNNSDDPELFAYFRRMRERGRFEVLPCPGPFNFSTLNNRAVQQARGELVGLINNDIEVTHPEWLGEMVSHAVRAGIGAVGAKLFYPDFCIQHAGVITGLGGVAGHAFKGFSRDEPGMQFRPHLAQNLSAVTAACLVIRKSTYLRAGGLDEKELAVAFNDVDFCLKVEALGFRNLYTPFAEFFHRESASRGAEDDPEKIRRFQSEIAVMKARWGDRLLNDPAYNPNLSLDSEDFAFAYPPRVPPLSGLTN